MKFRPKHLLLLLFLFLFLGIGSAYLIVKRITSTGMPSLEQLENPTQKIATKVLDSDGNLLDILHDERRLKIPLDSIPQHFIDALITSEDRAFYDHWGVDVDRNIKIVVKFILYGQVAGASTITQQIARNLFLTLERRIVRKIREIIVAVEIEKRYTKDQILEMYCNTVHFGSGAYGVQVASQTYFGKNASELSIGESAMLVGILPRPNAWNPLANYESAIKRRNLVLYNMHKLGHLSDATYKEEKEKDIEIKHAQATFKSIASNMIGSQISPHFVEMIRQDLKKDNSMMMYDLYRDGLVIHTTLNSKIQKYVNQAVNEQLSEYQEIFEKKWSWSRNKDLLDIFLDEAVKEHPKWKSATSESEKQSIEIQLLENKAFVDSVKNAKTTIQVGVAVIDPATGAILAMVGASPKFMKENIDAKYSLNHVTQIKRQPGSSFKPFVYSSALIKGWNPTDQIECGPYQYVSDIGEVWIPRGSGSCDSNEVRTLESALQWSINTVAARLITLVTSPKEVINIARKCGIKSPLDPYPALSLGAGGDVVPLNLISSYGPFAMEGLHFEPYSYEKIEDNKGNIIKRRSKNIEVNFAFSPEIAAQMTYMMENVISNGTATGGVRKYTEGYDAAGKTGTTNDAADAWFIGYTPQLVAGVWMGFDDKRITFDRLDYLGYGGRAAGPVWGRLMNKIYSDPTLPYTKEKTFSYKRKFDSLELGEYGLPYPLTEKQKLYISRNASLLHKTNPDSIKILKSEPEKNSLPILLRNQ